MSTIVDIYTSEVRNNLKPLFANWEPGKPVELGDYGVLSDDVFVHVGNIRDIGINFDVRADGQSDNKKFSSEGSTEVKLNAKGSTNISGVINAKANLEINFSSKKAVFFNAAECTCSMIRDKAAIGKEIMKRYKAKDWDRQWAVVTDVVKAGATTIVVSGASNSSIVLEASGDVDRIDLSDASVGLSVASQKSIGYIVDAKNGLSPLIGLSKIQSVFLWIGDKYKPLSIMNTDKMLSTMRNDPAIKTEELPEDVYFGQMK